ncbi:hypothetical protein K6U52_08425 [Vibrio vulnificus]|uniref:hypothetical protein n=1 Tax=Vibrio vulnificus TaxID=672 RepID=UPI001EEB0285|nr:hypothetical protein [Vibrio vulnificus]MCG6313287.1 hypothetical protein [Vibrio vulnificus]
MTTEIIPAIGKLLKKNPPQQFIILSEVLEIFIQSGVLKSAYVRGSLSNNTYDKISDVDLVVCINDQDWEDICELSDEIISHKYKTLFPAWEDKIVPDFGGKGFVHLINHEGKLYQIDLYIMPYSNESNLLSIPQIRKVYPEDCNGVNADYSFSMPGLQQKIPSIDEVISEIAVLSCLVSKRVKRGQDLLNYSESHQLTLAVRNLFRVLLDPEYYHYGWYHFSDRLIQYNENSTISADFYNQIISSKGIFNLEDIANLINISINLIQSNEKLIHKKPHYINSLLFLKGKVLYGN